MNPFKIIFLLLISHSIYSQIELWGVTPSGGQYNSGAIFKYMPESNTQTVVHSFNRCEGQPMINYLIKSNSDRFIGTSDYGGTFGVGTISEYDESSNIFTILHNFDYTTGAEPIGKLFEAPNGLLYGVTKGGGVNNAGILFSYNLTSNSFNKLIDFSSQETGKYPTGPLVFDNGFLFGTTSFGGANNFGVLFKFDINTNSLAKVLDFDGLSYGKYPNNSLMKASNGRFYGDTKNGGTFDKGSIFEYNPSNNNFTKKIDLDGVIIGDSLVGSMVEPTNGILYGATDFKTGQYQKFIFQYDIISNSIALKKAIGNSDFLRPTIGLTLGADNFIYYPKFSKLYKYDFQNNSMAETTISNAIIKHILFEPSGGKFWLTTDNTTDNKLVEFEQATNLITNKFNFGKSSNGYSPRGSLILGNDGNFYGVLGIGAINGRGAIFKFNPKTNTFTKKYEFLPNTFSQSDPLQQSKNGKFYGIASTTGNTAKVFIYEFNPDLETINKLVDFGENSIYNYSPFGQLVEIGDKFYGILTGIGAVSDVLYEFNPTINSIENKASFTNETGTKPFGSLIVARNGKLYGTTSAGTTSGKGSIFEYTLNSTQIDLKSPFLDNNDYGSVASAELFEANNGTLYGSTFKGGANNLGVLFEYIPTTNSYSKLFDLTNTISGHSPLASLIQALDKNLYGFGYKGGLNEKGTIFKYNINSNLFTKIFDFNGINGSNPNSNFTQRIATISTTKSGNWNDPTVWESGVVPANTSYVTINTNHIIDIDGAPIAIKYVEVKGTINFLNGGSLNLIE